MKKELLHINQLHCLYAGTRKLENVTLHIMEGDCIGFVGLSDSGKDFLVDLLCGETDENLMTMRLFFRGKRILKKRELKEKTYHIHSRNYQINNWTVAEYIGLVKGKWLLSDKQKRQMLDTVQQFLKSIGIDIDAGVMIGSLSDMQKRMLDLAKAAAGGYCIVAIEDDFEINSKNEMDEFNRQLHAVLNQFHMAAIINLHAARFLFQFPDKYIFFRDGRITKKCRREAISDAEQFDLFLLGHTRTNKKRALDAFVFHENMTQNDSGQTELYAVYNYQTCHGNLLNLSFKSGTVTSFIVYDDNERKHLFNVLSGRGRDVRTFWNVNGKRIHNANVKDFVHQRVVSVQNLGSYEDSFSHMTAKENLLIPSLQKVSSIDFVLHGEQIMKSDVQMPENLSNDLSVPVTKLPLNDYIAMTMERWCLFRPYAIIFMEPFARCDVYGVSIVKSYIKHLCKLGTSVIIIKNKKEYIEDISDKIMIIN